MTRSTNEAVEQKWRELANAARNEAAKLPPGSRARDAMLKRVCAVVDRSGQTDAGHRKCKGIAGRFRLCSGTSNAP